MIANRYQIETEIRRGAFGVIYKGKYDKMGEPVAIKIDHSSHSSLKHEVRIIQYLFMAGVKKIPSIYWFGIHENKPCVVMTLYECSLYDYYKKGSITESNLSKIMWLLLGILENIHKYFVVHRDIKPHNFMIKNGELFLIDFGLATFYMNEKGEHCPNTMNTTIIGSPYFASIRIHEGFSYSRRDDIISLGYLWIYMMGGSWNMSSLIENEKGSPIDLSFSTNVNLKNQKENIEQFLVTDPIKRYMKYVYSLEYDENPNYSAMKRLFV